MVEKQEEIGLPRNVRATESGFAAKLGNAQLVQETRPYADL